MRGKSTMPQLFMPKMGDAMEEGTILRWLKKEGDSVTEQEIVAEIETEKANIEIPATDAGVLTKILVPEGETVSVGTPIAELNGSGGGGGEKAPAAAAKAAPAPPADQEQKPSSASPSPETPAADLSKTETAAPAAPAEAQPAAPAGGRVKASPLARKVAAAHGVDLGSLQGTGPGGRIIEADVEEALKKAPAQPQAAVAPTAAAPEAAPAPQAAVAGTQKPLSTMRKVIARRLTQSKQTIPHFYLSLDVDMRAAMNLRKEYNAGAGEERKVSVNDLVLKATALALEKFPALNSRLDGDSIITPDAINLGVAVSLDEGLIVPVVKDAQNKSISMIAREVRALAEKARNGKLKPDEYSGGTFSLSNLGMYEITLFQAVINPPEAGILAVGAVRDTPIVEDGQVVPGKQMYLTVSVDHRIVDGQVAAQFLQEVKRLLQAPMALFG